MEQYITTDDIFDIFGNYNGIRTTIEKIPDGTICTDEGYGKGTSKFVSCTIDNIEYHHIEFPSFFLNEENGEPPVVKIYTPPKSGGRRTRRKRLMRRRTRRRAVKRKNKKTRR